MAVDTKTPRTRRAILAGGLAAALAGTLGRAQRASAHDPDDVRLGATNSSAGLTAITTTETNGRAFAANGNGSGGGVVGSSSSGNGVWGISSSGVGVEGHSYGDGESSIYGLKSTKGPAVKGEIRATDNGYAAVYGLTNGTGPGTFGENTKDGNGASGVARGTGSGIYGQSDLGRGATLVGKKAQLKLQPTGAATHPTSGQAGDLYVDSHKRLWFCKGGTTWKQLA